jgi:hypothetical protein
VNGVKVFFEPNISIRGDDATSLIGRANLQLSNGRQNALGTDNGFFAWAVRAGDVPEPSSIGLAVLALLSLLLLRKRS